MILQDKIAVVYGGAGTIGEAVARAFAAEGAKVHVTGRSREAAEAVVKDIREKGGRAEAGEVDALDEASIERHLQSVVDQDGRIDVSFNAIGIPDDEIVGKPLTDISAEQYMRPVLAYTSSYFHTARLAARHMIPRRSGVIMTVTTLLPHKDTTLNGGYGPAQAAKEAMTRDLSAELAPQGIRVVSLRPHGVPEAQSVHLKEMATAAVLLASDGAGGLTGTTVNLTMDSPDD